MAKLYTDVALRSPQDLIPHTHNGKRHPQDQIDRLAAQIAAHGFDQPIVVDRQGVIIKGHGRRQAALQLGLERVPVLVSDLTEDQARAARIADNQLASLEYDTKNLESELALLKDASFDLDLTGLDTARIDQLLAGQNFELPEATDAEAGDSDDGSQQEAGGGRFEMIQLGKRKVPATQEEVEALTEACESFEADHGTAFGFWSSLMR